MNNLLHNYSTPKLCVEIELQSKIIISNFGFDFDFGTVFFLCIYKCMKYKKNLTVTAGELAKSRTSRNLNFVNVSMLNKISNTKPYFVIVIIT